MSNPRVLLCRTALNCSEAAAGLEVLRAVQLENATKFLVTTGKFDAENVAVKFNVDAGYPADAAYLQTIAAWAEQPHSTEPRFRDGYDLFCLRRLLGKHPDFEFAVVLRDRAGFDEWWVESQGETGGELFLALAPATAENGEAAPNVVFRLDDDRTSDFLELAWELYATGAVFGMVDYSFDLALETAAEALRLVDEHARATTPMECEN